MTRPFLVASTLAALVLTTAPTPAQSGGNGGGNGAITAYIDSLPLQAIDAGEAQDLVYMRQEEKLARDVYRVLHARWGLQTFANIAQSEQSHVELVLYVMNRYGMPDPLTSDATGYFVDPLLSGLFQRLVALGNQSPVHALVAGALIEDLDMVDIHAAILRTDNRDVATVWQNLVRGSRNHLRAFYGRLLTYGITYRGVWTPYAEILAIVTSPVENEPVDENGDPL